MTIKSFGALKNALKKQELAEERRLLQEEERSRQEQEREMGERFWEERSRQEEERNRPRSTSRNLAVSGVCAADICPMGIPACWEKDKETGWLVPVGGSLTWVQTTQEGQGIYEVVTERYRLDHDSGRVTYWEVTTPPRFSKDWDGFSKIDANGVELESQGI
jgi:hypothetical protein